MYISDKSRILSKKFMILKLKNLNQAKRTIFLAIVYFIMNLSEKALSHLDN
jgi:hypothetical protein